MSVDPLGAPVLDVAPRLLGAVLRSTSPLGPVAVRLTEVEAYAGERDPGSHAFRGRTPRTAVMFGPPGRLYVYRHLGLHHCLNVVTGPDGVASAVLLRAGEVVEGADLARERRRAAGVLRADVDLARGPARLAVALGVDLADLGADLRGVGGRLTLVLPGEGGAPEPPDPDAVRTGPRVGVSGEGGSAATFPWRFWLDDEPSVSAYRAAAPRRARDGASRRPPGTAH